MSAALRGGLTAILRIVITFPLFLFFPFSSFDFFFNCCFPLARVEVLSLSINKNIYIYIYIHTSLLPLRRFQKRKPKEDKVRCHLLNGDVSLLQNRAAHQCLCITKVKEHIYEYIITVNKKAQAWLVEFLFLCTYVFAFFFFSCFFSFFCFFFSPFYWAEGS